MASRAPSPRPPTPNRQKVRPTPTLQSSGLPVPQEARPAGEERATRGGGGRGTGAESSGAWRACGTWVCHTHSATQASAGPRPRPEARAPPGALYLEGAPVISDNNSSLCRASRYSNSRILLSAAEQRTRNSLMVSSWTHPCKNRAALSRTPAVSVRRAARARHPQMRSVPATGCRVFSCPRANRVAPPYLRLVVPTISR